MSTTLDLFAAFEDEEYAHCGQKIELANASLSYTANFLCRKTSDKFFQVLLEQIDWKQEQITLYGKTHDVPRLSAWYGDVGKNYIYSGVYAKAKPWIDPLLEIKKRVELHCGATFNSVLVNLYRNGQDSVAWHSDDETELGEYPEIASVSLGEVRTFQMRSIENHTEKYSLKLEHGSCLFMSGKTQAKWQHQIPKQRAIEKPRINLTFRMIK